MAFGLYEESKIALEILALVVTIAALLISYKGYTGTKRSVFARLSLAFASLSINFTLQFFSDIFLIYGIANISDYFSLGASFFEMLGFFFLFFSHVVKVYQQQKLASLSLIIFNPRAAFKVLSLYFILYAALETMISYYKNKSRIVLITAFGLWSFAIQSILGWISEFVVYPMFYQLSSLVFQILGIVGFSVPIWIYYRGARS